MHKFLYAIFSLASVLAMTAMAPATAKGGVCPPGSRVNEGKCYACFPGSYSSGMETTCRLCPKNFFNPNYESDSCLPCPDGRRTRTFGTDSVDKCLDAQGNGPHMKYNELMVIIVCLCCALVALGTIAAVMCFFFCSDENNRASFKNRQFWKLNAQGFRPFKTRRTESKPLLSDDGSEEHIYESVSTLDEAEIANRGRRQQQQKLISSENDYEVPIPKSHDYEELVIPESDDFDVPLPKSDVQPKKNRCCIT